MKHATLHDNVVVSVCKYSDSSNLKIQATRSFETSGTVHDLSKLRELFTIFRNFGNCSRSFETSGTVHDLSKLRELFTIFRNFGNCLLSDTAQHPRIFESSSVNLSIPQILQIFPTLSGSHRHLSQQIPLLLRGNP